MGHDVEIKVAFYNADYSILIEYLHG